MIIRKTAVVTSVNGVKGWYILSISDKHVINCVYYAAVNFYSYMLNFNGKTIEPTGKHYFTEISIISTGLLL
jgi:hypothetical protein